MTTATSVSRLPPTEPSGPIIPTNGHGGDGGGGGGGGAGRGPQPVNNSRLGMLCALIGSSMLFSALIGAFIVLKHAAQQWPPEGSPPLPGLLGVSTAVLVASSLTMVVAHIAQRKQTRGASRNWMLWTTALGLGFLVLQGLAWKQLMDQGMMPRSSNFAGEFYIVTAAHAIHALVGVWLLVWMTLSVSRKPLATLNNRMDVAAMLWHFLGLVWLTLYFAVLV